jgi:hypothetical protein
MSYLSQFVKPVGCDLFANKFKMNYYLQKPELYVVTTVVHDVLLGTIIDAMMLLAFSSSSFYF